MKILQVEQGSDAWLKARLGMITGTRLKGVMAGPDAQKTLMYELVAEQISGVQEKVWVNEAMQWGTDHEDEAIKRYEKKTRRKTEVVGFCISDEFPYLANSPDRLIKTKAGKYTRAVEVKCPGTKNVVKYIAEGTIPKDYKWQVVDYFLVNKDLKNLDFVIYDPRIKNKALQLTIIKVRRKDLEKDIAEATARLVAFHEAWHKIYTKVRGA